MGKTLVIVESPAKAKTINRYLGKEFVVKSSVGHIRDLPVSSKAGRKPMDPKERAQLAAYTRKLPPEEKEAYKKKRQEEQAIKRMGLDPENGWHASYEILPGKEKVVAELRKIAADADMVYLATDLDREGEAIAWHLTQAIGGNGYQRVVFNEITKSAITEAFKHPANVDMNKVNAQQARRFLDRVVGYMVSPLLWAKIARGLSAGRVQSVAVRLIIEREREIHAFVPEEYWELFADLATPRKDDVRFKVAKKGSETFRPVNKDEAEKAVAELSDAEYTVSAREDKPTKQRPSPPFITSTLQQAASTRLKFSVKKTMTLAQRLYEAGIITYMRTDSTNLSGEALNACRGYIDGKYGKSYLPDQAMRYSSREGAQEAHEAIRPSDVTIQPGDLTGFDGDALRLYDLIWRRFVACQMTPAEFTSTSVAVTAAGYELRTRGRIMRFDGFTRVLTPIAKKEEDTVLPEMKVGEILDLQKLDPSQHFTKPAPRFTEASLVRELEKRGIGRPSTYASIISTIQDRGYVRMENRRFYGEKIGFIVTERLQNNFQDFMDYGFTAEMEVHLDDIAEGKSKWKEVLDEFYADFKERLNRAYGDSAGMQRNDPTDTDISCSVCGRNMQIRTGGTGVFLGCSGYSLPPKERCKNTINLIRGDEVVSSDESEDEEAESRLLRSRRRCPICNTSMDSYLIDEKRKLHVCGDNPDCPGFEVEEGEFRIKGYDGPVLECDKCGEEMQLKTGRFGKYFGCTSETCKNTRKLLRNGEPAPPKMDPVALSELKCQKVDDYYLLRDGASGMFLAASNFPKNRETRAPLLSEILPHKEEIDPKYTYLFSGPVADPDGNPAIIRFSRKAKEQYLMSEKDGKASGWTAHYKDGSWVESAKGRK